MDTCIVSRVNNFLKFTVVEATSFSMLYVSSSILVFSESSLKAFSVVLLQTICSEILIIKNL